LESAVSAQQQGALCKNSEKTVEIQGEKNQVLISSLTRLTLYFYNTIQLNWPISFNSLQNASLNMKKVDISGVRVKSITGPSVTYF